ncbi:PREDICTED: (RS)-norcoclaurine 6-O-methyltransferase-like [Camelina sativa]|uniref:(RS)-norcoclaurine 6-O-methyltransferase-like n=1 Tax=Camelina sativa TaxID=90675 RepID=A0ABM0UVJ7_CAMSA|nr:PREDICTED: (RS)-norcoclaurine 6-O-methyltransferase-like [Camelina sativa]
MEDIKKKLVDEEAKASLDIWRYVFGFADIAAAKCAIDLKIPEAIENHPSSHPVTLAELSSAVSASPSHLRRIMRFLVHQGLFKEVPIKDGLATGYTNTPLSRCMMITKRDGKSLAPFVLFETRPEMLAPWLRLSSVVSSPVNGSTPPPFDAVHGKDVWSFAQDNPGLSDLINEAMACDTRRVVPRVAGACHGLLDGVDTVVDVGGGTGETLGILVKEFPWIKGYNFDLPHVIEVAQILDGVTNIEGDMFDSIPACDAVFIKWVLHDWGDKDCIKILKNCKEAVPPIVGKVLIVESVIGENKKTMIVDERDEKLEHVRLMLDMVMMAHTSTGKERTLKEWDFVLTEAGFARYEVRDIDDVQCLIIAYRS